jgi:hypothetical protein
MRSRGVQRRLGVLLAATLVVGCSFAAPPIRYFEVRAP